MKRMKWFLAFRKRDDYVKICVLLFLTGASLLVLALLEGVRLYQMLHTPDEYLLVFGKWNSRSEQMMQQLQDDPEVLALTLQADYLLEIKVSNDKAGEQSVTLPCYAVSAAYLKKRYGVVYHSGEIYLPEAVFLKIAEKIDQQGNRIAYGSEGGILNQTEAVSTDRSFNSAKYQAEYTLSPAENTDLSLQTEQGLCKFRMITGSTDSEDYALIIKGDYQLKESSTMLRVYVKQQDIDGVLLKKFENKGLILQKEERYLKKDYRQKILFLKLRYRLLIGGLCIGFSVILWRRIMLFQEMIFSVLENN